MKLILTCIVLLSSAQYAYADATLEFKEIISNNIITYSIKNPQLKFTLSSQDRINLFDSAKQQFISFSPKSGKSALINEAVLNQRVSQLNQARLKKLALVEQGLEKKLQTMTAKEQQVGVSLINQLKYPELYGDHTRLSIKKLNTSKQINQLNCQVYQLLRANLRVKEFCMAEAKSLNMQTQTYQTLRDFYAFNYAMQTRIMLAMGKSRFTLIDFEQQKIPGVLIESIEYEGTKISQHLILSRLYNQPLAYSDFSLPQKSDSVAAE